MIDENVKWMTASSYSSAVPIEDIRPEINSDGFRATELKLESNDEEIKSEVYMYKQKSRNDALNAKYMFPNA